MLVNWSTQPHLEKEDEILSVFGFATSLSEIAWRDGWNASECGIRFSELGLVAKMKVLSRNRRRGVTPEVWAGCSNSNSFLISIRYRRFRTMVVIVGTKSVLFMGTVTPIDTGSVDTVIVLVLAIGTLGR